MDLEERKAFGDRISSIRFRLNLSERAAAKKLDVGRTSLRAWERGLKEMPSEVIVRTANAYGVTVANLFDPNFVMPKFT